MIIMHEIDFVKKEGQSVVGSKLTPKKVTLYVRWDWKRIVYCKVLPSSKATDLELYRQDTNRQLQLGIERVDRN